MPLSALDVSHSHQEVDSQRSGAPFQRQNTRKFLLILLQSVAILLLAAAAAFVVNTIRPDGLPWVGDYSVKAQLGSTNKGGEPVVSMEEAEALFLSHAAIFIDARPEEEFLAGHIEGARSLPWEDFDERFSRMASDIPLDSPIVAYCDGEICGLGKELALALSAKGYTHVRVLTSGWTGWEQAGLPVEK